MRKFLICIAVIMALTMIGGRAIAVTFGDGGVGLQGVLNQITIAPNAGVSSTNVLTDELVDSLDSYWPIHGSGGSVSTVIIELAAYANSNLFGIYDAQNPMKMVQIFDGAATSGSQALLSILSDGTVVVNFVPTGIKFTGNDFGYYLDSSAGASGGLWYSGTSLNTDGQDHMAAYRGKGIDMVHILPFSPGVWNTDEYILAFEDLNASVWGYPEPDYTDFVVMVESINPVPEPATLLLLGLGLFGVAGLKKKKFMG